MAKFAAVLFAYMLSVSSAFAADSAESIFAGLIANDQGIASKNVRVIITKGTKEIASAKGSIRIISLKLDTKFDNFYATVSAANLGKFDVMGKYEKLRQVPVLSRRVNKNETILAEDITYQDVNEKILSRGIITDENKIIGKGANRPINIGKPITAQMLTAPIVISKGSSVKAIYKSELLTIENSAVAMEDGAMGATIRLKNENSNKVIRGKVTAENTVELTPLSQVASN